MLKVDLNFFYKNVIRFILLNKLNNISNTYSIPYIYKLFLFFPLIKIEDVDHVQSYNYVYLFKFFFGKKAFFTRQKAFFNLGKWTYSFNVGIIFQNKNLYEHLFFLINDLLPYIDRSYLKYGVYSKEFKIFYLVIKDLNVFCEKKTNLGLFFLESSLNFQFFCNGVDLYGTKLLLRNLKLNFL